VIPASYQLPFPAATHALQPFQLISSSAWKLDPSALICEACPLRACVLSAASGGTETE
jgi:hypothetical protein